MKKKICAALLALSMACPSFHAQNLLNETQEQKDKRMQWFHKAKLGIFIHWGIYALWCFTGQQYFQILKSLAV